MTEVKLKIVGTNKKYEEILHFNSLFCAFRHVYRDFVKEECHTYFRTDPSLQMSRFGRVLDNTCCHDNALNTFSLKILNLERGSIKLMFAQLHIFKFAEHVYDCEHMAVKNYGTHVYVVTLRRVCTHTHLRERLLLQIYRAQRCAVFLCRHSASWASA